MSCCLPFLCCFGVTVHAYRFASRPGAEPSERESVVKRREGTRKREQDLYMNGLGVPDPSGAAVTERGRTVEREMRS
ncbi:hypothetical protein PENSPDRAFT_652065 [Peniophora sp. CONT]|nr:hypothetical protein PENSPDRAFT_652065 [Peniophora sp. CONT]